MIERVIYTPEADDDVAESYGWYEIRSPERRSPLKIQRHRTYIAPMRAMNPNTPPLQDDGVEFVMDVEQRVCIPSETAFVNDRAVVGAPHNQFCIVTQKQARGQIAINLNDVTR